MGVLTTQGYRGKLVDKLTGIILDQFSDEDIKVSTNILDLFDLGEIPGTFTQQITLPGTKKNNAYFEQYYDISVWEPDIFNTNQVNEAYLDFDGFYLVNGYIQLNKVNVIENKFVDSYEVTLFGIISNFSIDTRTSFLTDLSTLSAYNHTASYAAITSSWGRGLFNGDIVYPMAEYGQKVYYSVIDFDGIDDNERALVVRDYKPAIRIKKVWDACFNEFGYTYTGSFWNEPFLNDVYMICNNNLQAPVYSPDIETFGDGKVSNISGSTPINLTAATSASFAFTQLDYSYNNKLQLTGSFTKYTVDQKSTLDMTLDLAFKVTHTGASGSGMPAWYLVYVNDATGLVQDTQVLAGPINTYITTIRDSRVTTVTETFNLKGNPLVSATLPTGTYRIFIKYEVYGTANFSVQLNPDAQNMCQLSINRVRQLGDQQVIDIPSNMPAGTSGIKVIDFIRSVQKKFNLIIYPDKLNPNQFIVETFNNWYKQGTIKDFNKYINVKDKISFTPANQLGYKKVRFSDATDTDYITTLFKRTNNRTYGESNYYDSGSFYSQGSLDVVSDVLASGPLGRVPGSGYSGSVAIGGFTCTTYRVENQGETSQQFTYELCSTGTPTTEELGSGNQTEVCSRVYPYDQGSNIVVFDIGDCTPLTPAAVTGSSFPVWIPYYISDDKYEPAKVLPRLFYYNGLRNAPPYWIQGYYDSTKAIVASNKQTQYPYFDNYSTGSLNSTASQFPQADSVSLLYNNEQAVWGTTPTDNLITEYWSTYLELLYNPRTRLVDASAVIGLADYFDLELNDIAEFRGNYYHLRAINDYNLTTGEANIQMLGPIISDTISNILTGSWTPTTDACAFTYTVAISPSYDFMGITGSGDIEQEGPYSAYTSGSKTYIAGHYQCYTGNTQGNLSLINNDGTLDSTFITTTGTSGSVGNIQYGVKAFGIQKSTNKPIIGGPFNKWNNVVVAASASYTSSLIRLNSDGTNDTTFTGYNPFPPSTRTYFSVDSFNNGKLIIGTTVQGVHVLNADGTLSASVAIPFSGGASLALVAADDSSFYILNANSENIGNEQNTFTKYNNNGLRNTSSFSNGGSTTGAVVLSGTVQSDGKVLIVGRWNSYYGDGTTNRAIARFNSDGSNDNDWNYEGNSPSLLSGGFTTGSAVYVQNDGKILFGVRNATTFKLFRLTNSGSLDLTFNVVTGSFAGANAFQNPFDLGKYITGITELSNGNVLAIGPGYTDLVNGNQVKGWSQLYNSSGSKINNNNYLC